MSATTTASRLVPELRAICGAEYVVEPPERVRPTFDTRLSKLPLGSIDLSQSR